MNSIKLFLNSEAPVVIYTGGAGKGGSYTGLLKLKEHILNGHSCAVVMRNKPDLKTLGGIFHIVKEILSNEIHSTNKLELIITMKNGATISFLTPDELIGRRFDCIFVDNASQVDECYSLEFFIKRSKKQLLINTNSTKDRGFIFNLIKPYLIEFEDHYEFDKIMNGYELDGIQIIHGTCLDNEILLKQFPDYLNNLKSLSRLDRYRLLHGHYIKSDRVDKFGIEYRE